MEEKVICMHTYTTLLYTVHPSKHAMKISRGRHDIILNIVLLGWIKLLSSHLQDKKGGRHIAILLTSKSSVTAFQSHFYGGVAGVRAWPERRRSWCWLDRIESTPAKESEQSCLARNKCLFAFSLSLSLSHAWHLLDSACNGNGTEMFSPSPQKKPGTKTTTRV